VIKVKSEVKTYEENTDNREGPMLVESHWNQRELVGLSIDGGRMVYVVASDLQAAIQNATNTARL
jgi:hypothetical protein